MLKNYMKEGQKLPLYGVGPYIVYGMAMVNVIGIILLGYVFKIGILGKPWIYVFRIVGIMFIVVGGLIWFIGALRSDMDESITESELPQPALRLGWGFLLRNGTPEGVPHYHHSVC